MTVFVMPKEHMSIVKGAIVFLVQLGIVARTIVVGAWNE